MKRLLLTVVIWIVIVGGLRLYTNYRETVMAASPSAASVELEEETALEESVSLVITPTFSVEKDPFALDVDDAASAGMDLRVNGHSVTFEETMKRGISLTIADVKHLAYGYNEIFINASPPLTESQLDHGVRIQVIGDHAPILDKTLWSSTGAPVSGTLVFELSATEVPHDH